MYLHIKFHLCSINGLSCLTMSILNIDIPRDSFNWDILYTWNVSNYLNICYPHTFVQSLTSRYNETFRPTASEDITKILQYSKMQLLGNLCGSSGHCCQCIHQFSASYQFCPGQGYFSSNFTALLTNVAWFD